MDVPITLFMLFWAGIPTATIVNGAADGGFRFFFLPFLLIGAYMLVGRFYVDLWLRSHSNYVPTNRRALILKNDGESGIRSIKLAAISEVRLSRHRHGRSTLVFSSGGGWLSGMRQPSLAGLIQYEPGFVLIDDVARVYELAQRAVNEA
jgi:hypothetical protein